MDKAFFEGTKEMEKENRLNMAMETVTTDTPQKPHGSKGALRSKPYLDPVIMAKLRFTVSIMSAQKNKDNPTFH